MLIVIISNIIFLFLGYALGRGISNEEVAGKIDDIKTAIKKKEAMIILPETEQERAKKEEEKLQKEILEKARKNG